MISLFNLSKVNNRCNDHTTNLKIALGKILIITQHNVNIILITWPVQIDLTILEYPSTSKFLLEVSIQNSTSLNIFKSKILLFVKPFENNMYTCHSPIGIKYLTRLRLGFSHLCF